MRLIPSDPDVETIIGRIADGSLDLQPDFQRGTVWSKPKQRLLIDSILRGWYVPPVHVVRTSDDSQVVLDGQQRLNSIYEFVRGRFTVDGLAEPISAEIQLLSGMHYDDLPNQIRRRFDRFTVRVFEVVDYEAEEPHELFYRLNQPTPLTSAEKRNAFFGEPRDQVAKVTARAEAAGMTAERVGFSNARLAFEDIIARFIWTVEVDSLEEKATANTLTQRYRDSRPFDQQTLRLATETVEYFFSRSSLDRDDLRFNKAMLHSWLCFVGRARAIGESLPRLDSFIPDVEIGRLTLKRTVEEGARTVSLSEELLPGYAILNDRATARVNDVSSVMLRDIILWSFYCAWFGGRLADRVEPYVAALRSGESHPSIETNLLKAASEQNWGTLR